MHADSPIGKIEISPRAIASIASEAVLSCYGVVGMSATTLKDGIAEILQVESSHRQERLASASLGHLEGHHCPVETSRAERRVGQRR